MLRDLWRLLLENIRYAREEWRRRHEMHGLAVEKFRGRR